MVPTVLPRFAFNSWAQGLSLPSVWDYRPRQPAWLGDLVLLTTSSLSTQKSAWHVVGAEEWALITE